MNRNLLACFLACAQLHFSTLTFKYFFLWNGGLTLCMSTNLFKTTSHSNTHRLIQYRQQPFIETLFWGDFDYVFLIFLGILCVNLMVLTD